MNKKYCINCGNELETTDRFCHKCGASVETSKLYDTPLEEVTLERRAVSEKIEKKPRKSGKVIKPIIISIVVICLIASPFIVISILGSIHLPLGTMYYNIPNTGVTNIDFNVYNDVGSVTITYDDSITNLMEVTVDIRGGIGASAEDAREFEDTTIGDTVKVDFDSEQAFYNFFSMSYLSYEITILVNPLATVDFDITTVTGSINFDFNEINNIVVEDLSLISSTGSVRINSDNTINTTINELALTTSTGSIIFDFSDALNTSIQDFAFQCSTGSVIVDFGQNLTINSTDVSIITSTGGIDLEYSGLIVNKDLDWTIHTNTGSIDVEIHQDFYLPLNYTMNFDIQTSTGNIDVNLDTETFLGVEITATTSTGGIDIPGGLSHYESPDYHLTENQYNFVLTTSTGSIEANVY